MSGEDAATVVWRIATEAPNYGADDLGGAGAAVSGGRWNRPGTPLVYCASSISLATLETIVHLGVGDLPLNRYLIRVDLPADIVAEAQSVHAEDVAGWDAHPPGKSSLDAGERWVRGRRSALLIVPSVVVPEETNVLINPVHPDSKRIKATRIRRYTYDARVHA